MKKVILAIAALTAMTASASAADIAARPMKAPPPAAPLYNWTGFYIFGGAGGGIWAADQSVQVPGAALPLTIDRRQGGSGWFGTVGLGYDWQFNGPWVFGLFADGQFGSIKGSLEDPFGVVTGTIKLQDSYAAGARVGYLIAPNVLSYVNGGYSGSHWSGATLVNSLTGAPVGVHTDSFNRNGWFVGGGVENNLNIFGITAPGWFMKTEYRSAFYERKSAPLVTDVNNVLVGRDLRFNSWNQTISTSLVYRFNWGGAVVPQY